MDKTVSALSACLRDRKSVSHFFVKYGAVAGSPHPPERRAANRPTNWATSKTQIKFVLRILSSDLGVFRLRYRDTGNCRLLRNVGTSPITAQNPVRQGSKLPSVNVMQQHRDAFPVTWSSSTELLTVFCETLVEAPFLPLVALMGLQDGLQPHILRHLLTQSVRSPSPRAFKEKRFRSSIVCLLPWWNRLEPFDETKLQTALEHVLQMWSKSYFSGIWGKKTAPKGACVVCDDAEESSLMWQPTSCSASDPWRWNFNVPSERRLTATDRHGVKSRKT